MQTKMRVQIMVLVSQAALLAACGGPSGGDSVASAKTQAASPAAISEALPADGGDVGKAYNDLVTAYLNLDTARFSQLVNNFGVPSDPLTKKDTDPLLADMQPLHPTGGVRQGTRATLFLDGGGKHGTFSASSIDGHWVFDSMNPSSWQDDSRDASPNCKISQYFPCRAMTFPDAKVSGSATVYRASPNNANMPASGALLDGYGVRMLDPHTKALMYTQIVLSSAAFNPQRWMKKDVEDVEMGSVLLRIAPDGKNAKLVYVNAVPYDQHVEIDAARALALDASTPNRVRGHVTLDATDFAKIDATFDVGVASACLLGESMCGN